jgi:hypothetical protein
VSLGIDDGAAGAGRGEEQQGERRERDDAQHVGQPRGT